jgi:hypothetical protein
MQKRLRYLFSLGRMRIGGAQRYFGYALALYALRREAQEFGNI